MRVTDLIDFGDQPVSNRFLPAGSTEEAPRFPLALDLCPDDGLIQLRQPFPIEEVRPRYSWITYSEPEAHLDGLTQRLVQLPGVNRSSVIAGFSYKDDTTLDRLERQGFTERWQLDPVGDLDVDEDCAGLETLQAAMTPTAAERIVATRGPADIMVVRHALEHAYDLRAFVSAVRRLTAPGGYIVWEVPDCARSLSLGDYTMAWEEHVSYFTTSTLGRVLADMGLPIVWEDRAVYALEDSLIAVVRNQTDAPEGESSRLDVQGENDRARVFASAAAARAVAVYDRLEQLRQRHGPLAIFGAGHLAVTFLAITRAEDLVSWVIDDDAHKKGMVMPVGGIEIVGSEVLTEGEIGVCLLGINPRNEETVVARHQQFIDGGGVMASIFPASSRDLLAIPVA